MTAGESRATLRSTAFLGGAALLQAALNLLRTKVAAVLLGPAGLGLVGLFQGVMTTGSLVGSLGLSRAGVRQIAVAESTGDRIQRHSARAAVALQALVFAFITGGMLALFREPVAAHVLRDPGLSGSVGWISLGVALGVVGSGQFALLNGLRQVERVAIGQVVAAIVSTVLGVSCLFFWKERGLIAFVLVSPVATVLVYRFLIWQLPPLSWRHVRRQLLTQEASALVRVGFPAMLGGIVATGGLLAARAIVAEQANLELLGEFQAAWLISVTSITFILNAMLADFLPKISAAGNDHVAVRSLIARQQEMGLLMAAPIVLAVIAFASWVVPLLFSSAFGQTAEILRWHLLGDLVRVLFWPLSYALLGGGAGRLYLVGELVGMSVFLFAIWMLLPLLGGAGIGMAYLMMALAQALALLAMTWRQYGNVTARPVAFMTIAFLACGGALLWVAREMPILAAGLGVVAVVATSLFALARLSEMAQLGGVPGWLAARSRGLVGRIRAEGRPR